MTNIWTIGCLNKMITLSCICTQCRVVAFCDWVEANCCKIYDYNNFIVYRIDDSFIFFSKYGNFFDILHNYNQNKFTRFNNISYEIVFDLSDPSGLDKNFKFVKNIYDNLIFD